MRYLPKVAIIASLINLYACVSGYSVDPKTLNNQTPVPNVTTPGSGENLSVFLAALPQSTPNRDLLAESWDSYRRRFIQSDGRVIDFEASDRSTSEGQAYAMLRSVLIDDPETFAKTLKWSENNLFRQQNGKRTDSLWAWKWGKKPDGNWGVIDSNFASDGDIDAITALILASRRWNRPEYLELAKTKLQDLWNLSSAPGYGGKRYLLPGPKAAFIPNESTLYLNPSYLAPYAFRIFAQVDPAREWLSLVDTSYEILENSTRLSTVGLPSDWVALDIKTGQFQIVPQSSNLQSLYSFDAYRVWWRLSLDAAWFNSPQARRYLQQSTQHLQKLWTQQSRLPARIDLQGKPLVDYEATSQYAMFYAAMRLVKPALAQELLLKKLLPQYKQGIWGDDSAYYTQNLAWLGLLPPDSLPIQLIQVN
ncbi:glycosyl hydrolase family 8 [Calothrix sp. PCC 7507]|uniref:glycosyl hydrolase family 8 n=1 Tax=Calothrix sp. PCC 7507 TaxID=99598 RepID=UPI00029ED559|nr:glycosyl hydrolase family 8 [Calothrix sp. PCC 7507]AFY33498.1 glycoside hydrolase family 8 [Calothrix sp. PCC 7507]